MSANSPRDADRFRAILSGDVDKSTVSNELAELPRAEGGVNRRVFVLAALAIAVGPLIWWFGFRDDPALAPLREWQRTYMATQQKPHTYALELRHQRGQLNMDRIVAQQGYAAREVFGQHGRKVLVRNANGERRDFIESKDGSIKDEFVNDTFFTSDFGPDVDYYACKNGTTPPAWTFLRYPTMHMPLKFHKMTWEELCARPARRLPDDAQGRIVFELDMPKFEGTFGHLDRVLQLTLDPKLDNRLVRWDWTYRDATESTDYNVREVISWQTTPTGELVPKEVFDARDRYEVVNPTYGPLDPKFFDVDDPASAYQETFDAKQ